MVNGQSKVSIRFKLIFGFSVLVLVSLVTGAFLFTEIKKLETSSAVITQQSLPGIVRSAELVQLLGAFQSAQLEYSLANTDELRTKAEEKLTTATSSYEIYFKTFAENTNSDAEIQLMKKATDDWKTLSAGNTKFFELSSQGLQEEAQVLITEKLAPVFDALGESLRSLSEIQYDAATAASAESEKGFKDTKIISVSSVMASVFFAILISIILYRMIAGPLQKISDTLRNAADETLGHSGNLNTASSSLSANAILVSSSITETAAAVEEITSMIERTSNHAQASQKKSLEAQESAKIGQRSNTQLAGSMADINSGMQNINGQVAELLKSLEVVTTFMGNISDKTRLINDVVFQTKLLSFNASIEAARAGEHGKGFAVVAEEVGNLARMSGEASLEINKIISETNSKVGEIAAMTKKNFEKSVAESMDKLSTGVNTVDEFSQIFGQLVKAVDDVSGMISEISGASDEQSKGIREISQAMSQMSEATEDNSKSTAEVATSSSHLNVQVGTLRTAVIQLESLINGAGRKSAGRTPPAQNSTPVEQKDQQFNDRSDSEAA